MGFALGLCVAQISATVLLPIAIPLIAASDLISVLLFLTLVVILVGNVIGVRGRLRAFWILQAASWSIFLVNQAWWTYYDLVLKMPVPVYFAGDALPFSGLAFMLAACLLRPHVKQTSPSVRRGTLDFILLMVWWVYVYSYLVLPWQFGSPNEQFFNENYNALYFAVNVVLIAVLVVSVLQSEGRWRQFYGLFLCAAFLRYGSFVLENRAIEQDRYFAGSWYDCLFAGVFAVFIALALRGRRLKVSRERTGLTKNNGGVWIAGLAILAVLSLPVVLLFTAKQSALPLRVTEFRVLVTAIAMFVMAGLAFMKQFLMHQELKEVNLALEESAMTDPLTGLRNRRFFLETIQTDIAQALRARGQGDGRDCDMIFYLIDLDDFKQINDRFGHEAGDCVLKETAQRLRSASRDSDMLVRWGGEEFLIVSRHVDCRNAELLANRVLDAVRIEPFAIGAIDQVRMTCSIGWASIPWREGRAEPPGYDELLRLADRALYRAKRAGKDRTASITSGNPGGVQAEGDELEFQIFN